MKKWSVICFALFVLLGMTGLTNAQPLQAKNKESFTGVYNVTCTTNQKQNYSARIII